MLAAAALLLGGAIDPILGAAALAQERAGRPPRSSRTARTGRPNPPRSPAEAIRAMTVPPGFRVEVVAAEPDIVNPVAMTFDERGRIWITESLEYPRRRPGPGRDRVKVLEDTDGDGKADKFTIFADGLNIPSGDRRRPRRRLGRQFARHPLPPRHRRRRQGRHARSRRDRLRPLRHARAAQLADLGARRLALRLERRVQPQQGEVQERQDIRVHLRDLPHPSQDPGLRGLVRGDEQPVGDRDRPRGLVLRQRLRDRPPLAPGRDGLLHPPGRPVSAVHLADRVDRRPRPPEGGLLRHPLLRQPGLSAEYRGRLYMGNIHGNCINVDMLERNGSTYRPRPHPTSSGPTTPGSCRSRRRPAPTAACTSSTGTISITATRTPTATPPASTGSRGGSIACGTRRRRVGPGSTWRGRAMTS